MLIKIVLLVCSAAVITASPVCDTEKCPRPLKHYEELGCKPVKAEGECCPSKYQCPDFEKLSHDKCHYDGSEYNEGQHLPLNASSCISSCICKLHLNGPAKFECASQSCESSNQLGCTNIYGSLTECCPTNSVCEEKEKAELATCYLNNEKYFEGQKMMPGSNPCHECLCQKNFDNSTILNNPHCSAVNCFLQLKSLSFIQRGCIPIYYGEKVCCPIDWKCPEEAQRLPKQIVEVSTEKPSVFVVTPEKSSDVTTPSYQKDEKVFSVTSESKAEEVLETTTINPTTVQEDVTKIEDTQADQEITTQSSSVVQESTTHKYKRTPTIPSDIHNEESSTSTSTQKPTVLDEIKSIIKSELFPNEESNNTTEGPYSTTPKQVEEGGLFGFFKEPFNAISDLFGGSTTTTTEKPAVDVKVDSTSSAPTSTEKPSADEPVSAKDAESPEKKDEKHETTTDGSTYVSFTVTLNNEQYNIAKTTEKDEIQTTTEQEESTTIDVTTISSENESSTDASPTSFVQTTEFVNFTVSIKKSDEHMDKVVRRSIQLPFALNRRRRDTEISGCVFDGKNLKVSEKIEVESKCLECICELPPLAHCIKKENCQES